MKRFYDVLKKYWGYDKFRPLQDEIIESVAQGKDTLGLMPTGGGKSLTFQVPTMAMEGICIVVSPLVALMKDQVDNLRAKKIKAELIHSALTHNEIQIILDKCLFGDVKFLYISPERIGSDLFRKKVAKMNVCLIAVDESHCISQWGYDFRPSYLKIVELRELLPQTPVLALTATATIDVVDDIQERLRFPEKNVFRKSFERENLIYLVRNTEDKNRYLLKILTKERGTSVVYVRSRKKCKEIAEYLKTQGIKAEFYHAGLKNTVKDYRQERWKKGMVQVMVATNAFGMGIDKSDVRTVVHMDLPDSLEAYFQEAGRAGRDGKRAYAIMLYSNPDKVKLQKRIPIAYPKIETIKEVYKAIGNYYQIAEGGGRNAVFDFDIGDFCKKFGFNILQAYNSLKLLQRAGYLVLTDNLENETKIHFSVKRDDLYKFQLKNDEFNKFIKLLLRTYTGLFTNYVPVNLDSLAKQTNTKREVFVEFLKVLSKHKIIDYIPRKKTPFIVFSQERMPLSHVSLPPTIYKDRKNNLQEKINAVIAYAESENICHSKFLLEYFGQGYAPECGKCDICKAKTDDTAQQKEFKAIYNAIYNLMQNDALSMEEIVAGINHQEAKTIEVVRFLLDNEEIEKTTDHKLKWIHVKKLI